jgi:hypothetical protein
MQKNKDSAALVSAAHFLLKYYTDESAAALVNDPFKRLTDLFSCIIGHIGKLCVKSFVDQLMKRRTEDV